MSEKRSIWKGPAQYTESDHLIYGGRNSDLQDLFYSIASRRYTLLYGKSGVGKSSFLRAGLNMVPFRKGILKCTLNLQSFDLGSDNLILTLRDYISNRLSLLLSVEDEKILANNSGLAACLPIWARATRSKKLLLIFDQFERVFVDGSDPKHRLAVERFLYEISSISEGNETSNAHIILGMREDYLPLFHNLIKLFPRFNNNLFRLSDLTGLKAIDAILKPARQSVNSNVLTEELAYLIIEKVVAFDDREFRLIHDLTLQTSGKKPIGLSWKEKSTTPLILSLYCDRLYHKADAQITSDTIKANPVAQVLEEYFEECIEGADGEVIDNLGKLISNDGKSRKSIKRSEFLHNSPTEEREEWINRLLKKRLIKEDDVYGTGRKLELVHDTFAPFLAKRRDERLKAKAIVKFKEAEEKKLNIKHLTEKARIETRRRKTARALLITVIVAAAGIITSLGLYSKENLEAKQLAETEREASNLAAQGQTVKIHQSNLALNLLNRAVKLTESPDHQETRQDIYQKGRFHWSFVPPEGWNQAFQIDHRDNRLFLAGAHEIIEYDTSGNQSTFWTIENESSIRSISRFKTEKFVVIYDNHVVEVRSFKSKKKSHTFQTNLNNPKQVQFSKGGNSLLIHGQTEDYVEKVNISKEVAEIDTLHFGQKVLATCFGPKDNSVFVVGNLPYLKEWSINGTPVKSTSIVNDNNVRFYDIDLSPDESSILLAGTNGRVYSRNLSTDSLVVYNGSKDPFVSVAFSHGNHYITAGTGDTNDFNSFRLTGDMGGLAKLWHISGDLLQEYSIGANEKVSQVAFSSDNKFVFTAGQDGAIKRWSTSGIMQQKFPSSALTRVSAIKMKPSDCSLIEFKSQLLSREFMLRCMKNGVVQDTLLKGYVKHLANQDSSQNLLAVEWGGKNGDVLHLFSSETDTSRSFPLKSTVDAITMHPTKPHATISLSTGELCNWYWEKDNQSLDTVFKHQDGLRSVSLAFSEDGKTLASGLNRSGRFELFSTKKWALVYTSNTIHHTGKWVSQLAFSDNGKRLACASDEGSTVLWDLEKKVISQRLIPPLKSGSEVTSLCFSKNGSQLLTTTSSGKSFLWRCADGILVQEISILNDDRNTPAINGAFSHDEKSIIIQHGDGSTRIWEIRESLESFLRRGQFDKLTPEQRKHYGVPTPEKDVSKSLLERLF